jgi:prophage regulatory protein
MKPLVVDQNEYITSSSEMRRLLRLRQVLALVPVSRSTFYARVKAGSYPRPVKLGRISCWRSEDIDALIRNPR